VGPETKGVEKMLRRVGFQYAHRIDPFDGGPHFQARVDDVTVLRQVRRARVVGGDDPEVARAAPARLLVATEGGGETAFRAVAVTCVAVQDAVGLPADARRALGVAAGTEVAVLAIEQGQHASG